MATESEPKNLSEMSEEEKFRAKFPGRKPTTTDVMRKRLQKGGVKYFDSGDYAMAKSSEKKGPIPHRPNLDVLGVGRGIPTPDKIPHRKSSVPIKEHEHQDTVHHTHTPVEN
ncbi:alpha-endosulfine [Exaiptasia diaphana]|uniref:Alpha-endosulfine n=1 Tax=Exaiptasia diaphana TaxID=2652724 RepID=A0A913XP17_EXADI|nr:alpha-endosulfine [Exaiptasia diaphana]KXJ10115.1 Alpha-endosulfine [Exaiptasia diaphana]